LEQAVRKHENNFDYNVLALRLCYRKGKTQIEATQNVTFVSININYLPVWPIYIRQLPATTMLIRAQAKFICCLCTEICQRDREI